MHSKQCRRSAWRIYDEIDPEVGVNLARATSEDQRSPCSFPLLKEISWQNHELPCALISSRLIDGMDQVWLEYGLVMNYCDVETLTCHAPLHSLDRQSSTRQTSLPASSVTFSLRYYAQHTGAGAVAAEAEAFWSEALDLP